jgi:hypothetical protein
MHWFELVIILFLSALAWLWFDSVRARETAVRSATSACRAAHRQFLDDTVAIARLRLARDDAGRLLLERTYRFEFSDTGNNRRPGQIRLLGQEIVALQLPDWPGNDADPPAA